MTASIDHTNCLHQATKAGRAACRKLGGPRGYASQVQSDMIASGEALCRDCFWNATNSALMNLEDHELSEGKVTDHTDPLADAIFTAIAYTWAREYLYDRSALSACTDHEHLL